MQDTEASRTRWQAAQHHEAAFWQRDDVYANEMHRVVSRYQRVIELVDATLSEDARILDVGCGPTCPARLFRKGHRAFLDPLMPVYAAKYGEALPPDTLLAAVGEAIPFRDHTIDVVTTFNALDHTREPELVLEEIHRVLQSDGRLIFGLFCHPPIIAKGRRLIEAALPFLREDAHPYSYTHDELRALASKRFRVIEEHLVFSKNSKWHREDWVLICQPR